MKILYYNNKSMLLFLTILLTFFMATATAQNSTSSEASVITGTVTDDQGEPLIGATVIVKGTMVGVATGMEGDFSIKASPSQSLIFTYLGYDDIEITVGKNKKLKVRMTTSEENTLEEVVVVGYGTMRKSDLTGSVASVSAEVFESGSQSNFAEALQGQVAGVEVSADSGALGGAVTINIRGSNSLTSAEPLYIIDGVAYDNSYLENFEEDGSYQSPLASINPSDIASMEILKDASATAIYGSEASNGVVLITTKSGQAGKPKVTINFAYAHGEVTTFYDMFNYNEYLLIRQESYENESSSNVSAANLALARRGLYQSYPWQELVTQGANSYNATASISGGSDGVKYMLSLNGYTTTGVVLLTNFQRITGRLNVSFDASDKVNIGTNISMSYTSNDGTASASSWGSAGVMSTALTTSVNKSMATEFGDIEYDEDDPDSTGSYTDITDGLSTPYLTLAGTTKITTTFSASANLFATYKIITGLSLKVSASYSMRETFAGQYKSTMVSSSAFEDGGYASVKKSQSTNLANEYTLSWVKTYNKKHKLNFVAGFSVKQADSNTYSLSVENFPHDEYLWYNLDAGTVHDDITNSYSQSRSVSWFGRFNYTLSDRYLFTFTGRVDGNSRFAEGNKYSSYPAGAFAWRISQEPWMKGHRTISDLKLRVSYGVTGNKATSSSQALNIASTSQVTFGNSSGDDERYISYYNANTMKNTQLTWETTTQGSIGVDLNMFKNRLKITAEAYRKDTRDLLVSASLDSHTGYTTSYMNYGNMYNQGVELTASYAFIQKKDFNLTAGFNISRNRAVLGEVLGGTLNTGYWVSWLSAWTTPLENGDEIGTFKGYVRNGVRQEGEAAVNYTYGTLETEVGDYKFVDTNGDGILDSDDKQVIGQAQSDFSYGLNLSVTYKNLSLRVYGQGAYAQDKFNIAYVTILRFTDEEQLVTVLERWTPDNPTNEYPKVRSTDGRAQTISRMYIEDATYFRIKTISLSYNLPSSFVSMLRLGNIRVYASVTNPFLFTNYSGFNPDANLGGNTSTKMGHDSANTPGTTTFTAGLDIQF